MKTRYLLASALACLLASTAMAATAPLPVLVGKSKSTIVEPKGYTGVNHPPACRLDNNSVPDQNCTAIGYGRDPATGR